MRPDGLHQVVKTELGPDNELDDKIKGILAIWLISLLRTQLKSDLTVYGPTYADGLSGYQRFFLAGSNVNLWSEAWAEAAGLNSWWARLGARLGLGRDNHESKGLVGVASGAKRTPAPLLGNVPTLDIGERLHTSPSSRAANSGALGGGSDSQTPRWPHQT